MYITINFKSGMPAYLQIVDQVKYGLAAGELVIGDILPSIRALAEELKINRNTVAKAYSQLEYEGVVETIRGKGVFVSSKATPFGENKQNEILSNVIDSVVVQAFQFNVDKKELLKLVEEKYNDFENKRQE